MSLVAALALMLQAQPRPDPRPALQVSGIDHVGINVPDAGTAAAFFHELIGTLILEDVGPVAVPMDWKKRFRWHASTKIRRRMVLQTEDGTKIELFQYAAPQGSKVQPHEDDAGATHIAFKARNVEQSLALVRRHGLRVLNEPVTLPDGTRWFYFLTPWGSQIELIFSPGAE